MAAKFEIRSSKTGEFNWVLTSQGRTLATGESYTRKASAEKAIESLRSAAGTATVADLTLPPAKTAPAKAAKTAKPAKAAKTAKPAKAVKSTKPAKAAKTTKAAKTKAASGGRKATATKKAAAPRKRTSKSA